MNYTWNFDKQKPVAEFTFEELLKYFTPHIRGYAFRSLANHVPYAQEDLQQESNLVLWKCFQKYKNLSNVEFVKLFKGAMHNRIAEIMRVRESARSKPEANFDEVGAFDIPANTTKVVVDAGFYDREITRLAEQVSGGTRAKIMSACQPDSNGRRNRLSNKQAVEVVEKINNGN